MTRRGGSGTTAFAGLPAAEGASACVGAGSPDAGGIGTEGSDPDPGEADPAQAANATGESRKSAVKNTEPRCGRLRLGSKAIG